MMMNVKCLDTGTTHSADALNEKARHSADKLGRRSTAEEEEEEAAALAMMMNVKCLDTGTTHNAEALNEHTTTFAKTPPSSPPTSPFQKMKPATTRRPSVSFQGDDEPSGSEASSDEGEPGGRGRGEGGGSQGGGARPPASTFAGNPFKKNLAPPPKATHGEPSASDDSGSNTASDSDEEESDDPNDHTISKRGSLLGRLEASKGARQSPSTATPAPKAGPSPTSSSTFGGNPFKKNPPPPVPRDEEESAESDDEPDEPERPPPTATQSPKRGWSNPFRKASPSTNRAPTEASAADSDSESSVDADIQV